MLGSRLPVMDNDDGIVEERQTDPETLLASKQKRDDCRAWCIIVAVFLVFTVCTVGPIQYLGAQVHYSVAIDSVSGGVDPTTMGLSFNLTLGVASRSYGAKACVDPGMYVEVFYHGVQLAASDTETTRHCAEPRKAAELPVLARATGVPVGHVLEDLVKDMNRQDMAAVFDVILHVPAGSYGGAASQYDVRWVSECERMRIGQAAAAPCNSPDQDALFG